MAQLPADSLKNRSFIGLIIAQFLAGFNDQAIHASAMFYAVHKGLDEKQAITLMPILFYAPWAIFCTVAGYYADRYSKTKALVIWKFSEVAISLILLLGVWIGLGAKADSTAHFVSIAIVMSTVFMMGTHAAFFAPAKYGSMPEILQPHVLSKGNGILESTTFLASILGTVIGGFLSFRFRGEEYWIAFILLGLSIIGALASLMIQKLPAATPEKRLPRNIYAPLFGNLKELFSSRPLALSVMGIAFFIFMVAYMRSVMYMHGQSRVPPWDEFHTSSVVAVVALGVGLGSPLAGFLSGGKIELGLVPLGCMGMIFAAFMSGLMIDHESILIVSLIIIGFFSGFYMVPLYTLLQHRAPKKSKGELVATSNFINVTGAIAASLLFGLLAKGGEWSGITPGVTQRDLYSGTVSDVKTKEHHVQAVRIATEGKEEAIDGNAKTILLAPAGGLEKGDKVVVSNYRMRDVEFYRVRPEGTAQLPEFEDEALPRYLFFGAALMSFGILLLLLKLLPDLLVRTLFWFRSLGKFEVKAVGTNRLPTAGALILATNARELESSLQLLSATDRTTTVVLPAGSAAQPSLLRSLALRSTVVTLDNLEAARNHAKKTLARGELVVLAVDGHGSVDIEAFYASVHEGVPVAPVYCGPLEGSHAQAIRVVFGEIFATPPTLGDIRLKIGELKTWIQEHDHLPQGNH